MLPRADFRLLISIAREREKKSIDTHRVNNKTIHSSEESREKKNVNKPKHNKKNQPDMNDPFDLVHPPSSLSFYPFESRLISILHFRTFTTTTATPSPAGNHFSNQIPFTLLSICCTPSFDAPCHGHFDVCTPRHYFSITIERKKGEYE